MTIGWDNLQKYRTDGNNTMDDLPAERTIRPFTVYCKNMEHIDIEVSDAIMYMALIETLRMWGYNVKRFLEQIFTDAIKDISDHTNTTRQ